MRTSPLPPQAEDVARRLNNLAALFDGDGVDLASRVGRVIDIWQARKTGGDCVCARARARARARRAPSSHLSGVRFSLCALQESARTAAREFRACARPSHRHCATRGGMLAAIPPFSGDAISIPACTRRSATGRWFVCEQVGVRGRSARAHDGSINGGCSRNWDIGRDLQRTTRR